MTTTDDFPPRRCSGPHKFTVYGWPGVRAPHCVRWRCDAPNPRPLTEAELRTYEGVIQR